MGLQAEKACSFEEFTDLIFAMLNAAWGEGWGTFCEAFPNGTDPQNVDPPIITYSIVSKVPGIVGNAGTQEAKPRFRQGFKQVDGETTREVINVHSQIFDYHIRFDVWEENNTKLSQLADRFEDFMMMFTGYFMQQGVSQIRFLEMRSGSTSSLKDQASCRHFLYLVRLEKHVEVPSAVITEVITRVEVVKTLDDPDQHKEVIDFKLNKGGNS